MMIFDKARENAEAIRRGGLDAIEECRLAGVPAYYMDAGLCTGIVREMPDGSRQHVKLVDGADVVVEELPRV